MDQASGFGLSTIFFGSVVKTSSFRPSADDLD